jgi:type 1 glutamine amidotransferase
MPCLATSLSSILVFFLCCNLSSGQNGENFVSIFDGKTLSGWDGKSGFWSVREGAITGQTTIQNPTEKNTFLIWRGGDVGNFELKLEYRVIADNKEGFANSGIQYRSFEIQGMPWVVGGYQADLEAGERFSGIFYGERSRGILSDRGQETLLPFEGNPILVKTLGDPDKIQSKIRQDDWNEYHIIANGYHFTHKINGVVTAVMTDLGKVRRPRGILALQLHAGLPMTVQFRDIRVKPLLGEVGLSQSGKKKVVFVAGKRSHGYGAHEHYAGSLLLARSLLQGRSDFRVDVTHDGWPDEESVFTGADTVVLYADGGKRHPALPKLETLDKLARAGVGVVCLHYGTEVPREAAGYYFLKWIGGYFESDWSVNPHWVPRLINLADHSITAGVSPFEVNDEWYYHMRFRDEMAGIVPILTALPGPDTLTRPDGSHSGNPHVRASVLERREPQHLAWAAERENGGRGFGFTGGHHHWNWGDTNFRRLVLNAIVWTAHAAVAENGVVDDGVGLEDLESYQDYDPPQNYNREDVRIRFNLP